MRAILALLLLLVTSLPAAARDFDMSDFREIPILNEGRVKPLESFARSYLIVMSGQTSLGDLSASAWLAETVFDKYTAYERPLFRINAPHLRDTLSLPKIKGHRYSYNQIITALQDRQETTGSILNKPEDTLSPEERAFVNLYFKTLAFAEISHSLSLILPNEEGESFIDTGELTPDLTAHQNTRILRLIPPLWEKDGGVWSSPWQIFYEGRGSPASAAYLALWQELAYAYLSGDETAFATKAKIVKDAAYAMAGENAHAAIKALEVLYHDLDLFTLCLMAYIACFILLMVSLISGRDGLGKITFGAMSLTAIAHLAAIILRMIIMERPPVTSLYETTIFVSLIAVIICLAFEARRKDSMMLLSASMIGSVLLFISRKYAGDGDTMQMLVAVLDTNFWLGTHVVTITMGYGAALVAGTLAHFYLVREAFTKGNNTALLRPIQATGLIALFFSILGTILGGIWADQSWGRFWGWDPKENGALLVCLWLLFCFHGRLTGQLSPRAFAALMALGNAVIALAWFGVNLLSAGLHSYGFTQGIALPLGLFCSGELAFVLLMLLIAKHRKTAP